MVCNQFEKSLVMSDSDSEKTILEIKETSVWGHNPDINKQLSDICRELQLFGEILTILSINSIMESEFAFNCLLCKEFELTDKKSTLVLSRTAKSRGKLS